MDRAIATAGDDGIESFADRHANLRSRVRSCARRSNINFDAGSSKDCSGSFHVLQTVFFSPARVWIVEKGGFAHGRRILYEQALPLTPAIVLD
jgi:hypothetical protein